MAGTVALVTGASTGIGRAIALGFARAGADVAVNYRTHHDEANTVVAEIESLGRRAVAACADITDENAVKAMVAAVGEDLGPVDALVCNAGVPGSSTPTLDLALTDWHHTLRVHLDGVLLSAREVVRQHMAPRGSGTILITGSIAGSAVVRAGGPSTAYRTAKAGLQQLTRNLALEWVTLGIRVNTILPGFTRTSSVGELFEPGIPMYDIAMRDTPMARSADPDEMVGPAVFLSTRASSFVTGAALAVDGGYLCL
jgi:NAD(P)-dependent dehydrogenase (short-subunit alcohol dehydrogenase family)